MNDNKNIRAVLFDFGGVLAEEGYKNGLRAIAVDNGITPKELVAAAFEINYETGFILGKVRDDVFWENIREKYSIEGSDQKLTEEILSRFILRPWMLDIVKELKEHGIITGILSDQCHWLDELDRKYNFFKLFDHVFNSYHIGISKIDPGVFDLASKEINIPHENILFIDDHEAHIIRAKSKGMNSILYTDKTSFTREFNSYLILPG